MKISIVIPIFYSKDYIEECVASIQKNTKSEFELIVIDNGCPEDSAQLVKKQADKLIENDENLGFGPACNQGVEAATNELIVLLNADTVVEHNWDVPLIEALDNKSVGIASPMYLNKDGSVQEAGGLIGVRGGTEFFGEGLTQDNPRLTFSRAVTYTSAAGIMLRKSDFKRLGEFGAEYKIAYHEDSDLMLKYKEAGFIIKYVPSSKVTHIKSTVIKNPVLNKKLEEISIKNGIVLQKKWALVLSSFPSLAYPKLFPHNRFMARDLSNYNILIVSNQISDDEIRSLDSLAKEFPEVRVTLLTEHKVNFTTTYLEILTQELASLLKDRLCNFNSIVLDKDHVDKTTLDQINYLQPATRRYAIGKLREVWDQVTLSEDKLSAKNTYFINKFFASIKDFIDTHKQNL